MTFESYMCAMADRSRSSCIVLRRTAEHWLKRWQDAEQSIALWGEHAEGLEKGAAVRMLVSGHGNIEEDVTRRFEGVFKGDERYFAVSREDYEGERRTSLVERRVWWSEMGVPL